MACEMYSDFDRMSFKSSNINPKLKDEKQILMEIHKFIRSCNDHYTSQIQGKMEKQEKKIEQLQKQQVKFMQLFDKVSKERD